MLETVSSEDKPSCEINYWFTAVFESGLVSKTCCSVNAYRDAQK